MMPYEATAPFSTGGISGVYRFLKRIFDLRSTVRRTGELSKEDLIEMNKTIKKVGEDLENFRFNTAIAAIMTWLNHLSRKDKVSSTEYENLLKILAPFSPHISEELWEVLMKKSKIKNQKSKVSSIHNEKWPKFDSKFLEGEEINIAVQVNGKLRGTVEIKNENIKNKNYIEKEAKGLENIRKYLNGKKVEKVIYIEGKVINFVVV